MRVPHCAAAPYEGVPPPGLHPIVPPAMSLLAWDVSESPWGAFSAAFVRVVCRSGACARTFCVGAAASACSNFRCHERDGRSHI